jgi:hypothetical protein
MRTESRDSANAALKEVAGCVNAVPALWLPKGFRLLTLRCFHNDPEPPAFAWIDQRIFRAPDRLSRHGLFFGAAFRPEVMDWLIARVGRPSFRGGDEHRRNPDWPIVSWRSAERAWPDETRTTEWSIQVGFVTEDLANAFREHWRERLAGARDS